MKLRVFFPLMAVVTIMDLAVSLVDHKWAAVLNQTVVVIVLWMFWDYWRQTEEKIRKINESAVKVLQAVTEWQHSRTRGRSNDGHG